MVEPKVGHDAGPGGGAARNPADRVDRVDRIDPPDLETFLVDIGPRGLVMARIATRNPDEAMDLVQEAMLQLSQRYADRPPAAWRPLFYRILQSRIRDWMRRERVRNRFRTWFRVGDGDGDGGGDPLLMAPDRVTPDPARVLDNSRANAALRQAVAGLPGRQREAFLLRAWEGLSVADTATAMACSAGSVKTHYFRAVHALRKVLGEHEGLVR